MACVLMKRNMKNQAHFLRKTLLSGLIAERYPFPYVPQGQS